MTPRPPTVDPEVLARAQKGEREALARLLRDLYPVVRRWVAGLGRSPDTADDVTQEVMIRVLRSLSSFRGDARFSSWLYRITRNACLDRARGSIRRERREEEHGSVPASGGYGSSPDADTERAETGRRIEEAFRSLPDRQRAVFDLVELQGLGSPEVAELLGVKPATVRVTLLHARRALRARLIEMDPELRQEYGS